MTEQAMREDFRLFLIYIWRFLGLPDPTPVQLDIAYYLQHGPRRKGIKAFRGVGKSWITSAYVVWRLWNDVDLKCLVVSASKERSDAFSIFTKRLLAEVPILQHLQPDIRRGDRDSNVAFDIRGCSPAHAPSVKSIGITGQMTGSRADLVVGDDVEVVNNSETATQREKIRMLVAEMGGAILTPGGEIVFLGTPQVEDSLYNHLPDSGYEFKTWPAEIPDNPQSYAGGLGPCILKALEQGVQSGDPTDPARFDSQELHERKLEYGRIGFALQFQLDTSLSDADRHPLRLQDFIVARTDPKIAPEKFVWAAGEDTVMDAIPAVGLPGDRFYRAMAIEPKPEWSPYEGKILYIDPSGRGRDTTGYAVVAMLHGYLVVRRWGFHPGGYEDRDLSFLASIAREEEVNAVIVESNFGDGMFAQLLRPILGRVYPAGCGVEDDHVTGQKEARIADNLEPAMARHRVILDEQVVIDNVHDRSGSGDPDAVLKTPFYQLTRLTRDRGCLKFDDALDALAGAVRWWTERMARDEDQAIEQADSDRQDRLLELFQEGLAASILGKDKTPSGPPKRWDQPLDL